ncbi:uncharacterized protein PV09_04349 [Verruconis gallopava]|uniref:Zn(2)-C6 fungal-type domain-containing protein n=1 Tax=Verruconis gallopava TaxID=253628 RepID=A0A0D1XPX0_9PEZI|nr:uncharacterized protein PV09_04349 [Verruconis gallopava]KIW04601.1 hypothetical protein PV09_04349 [Verruconis gallopava]
MEEESSISKSQRARLTCSECYRRKIKCDKNIPCGTCIKRGLSDLCKREEQVSSGQNALAHPSRNEQRPHGDLVRTLLDRVSQLEAKLDQGKEPTRVKTLGMEIDHISSPFLPANAHRQHSNRNVISTSKDTENTEGDEITVLEFLAWGRKKNADFGDSPEDANGPRKQSVGLDSSSITTDFMSANIRNVQLDMLEALLPASEHIKQLVEYHNKCLLWYHGSYSSKTMNDDLHTFFTEYSGSPRHEDLNLQWLALLFAILCCSITCSSPRTCRSWGFSNAERNSLSLKWYEATVTCLNMARYIEVHSIYSVQAISTLTISAHILGLSNSQSVLLSSAGRIAQSLGLHRLGSETESASSTRDQLRKRESARRVFIQLCIQDWFSIPFSDSYALDPRYWNTVKPLNCNDEDMSPQPQSIPTDASYCNYRYDIAALMPQLLDAVSNCNTLFTKYEKVLEFDEKMRKLVTAYMPTFLSTGAPVASSWPPFVSWARRSLTICAAHKIIMIHRKFLGLSFTNSAFSFTRRTCLAASKTIMKEALSAVDENGPILWIEQAFTVAACIIFSLDAFHRNPNENEYEEHRKYVSDGITYLKRFENSKIATRGVQLLSSLQQALEVGRKRPRDEDTEDPCPAEKRVKFDIKEFIKQVSQNLQVTTPAATPIAEQMESAAEIAWDNIYDLLPPGAGFGGQNLFDDFFAFHP